jgi:methionine--tRNA ligase beta chain
MKPEITIEDFAKLELRAGRIVSVEAIPKSKKLLKLEVSFGPEIGNRTIVAGIAQAKAYGEVVDGVWKDSALVGTGIVAVLNLAPREMFGIMSHGMLLAIHVGVLPGGVYLISPGPAEGGEEVG